LFARDNWPIYAKERKIAIPIFAFLTMFLSAYGENFFSKCQNMPNNIITGKKQVRSKK